MQLFALQCSDNVRVIKTLITNLEKRSNVNIKSKISESCSDHLSTSIVSVLAHFSHQDPRTTAFLFHKSLGTNDYTSMII